MKSNMRGVFLMLLATAAVFIFVSSYAVPARALKFTLNDPADHPDKIATDAGATQMLAQGAATSTTSTSGGDTGDTGDTGGDEDSDGDSAVAALQGGIDDDSLTGDGKYNGVYEAWKPLQSALPLKVARVSLRSVGNDHARGTKESVTRSFRVGSLYLEGDKPAMKFKTFDWKAQYNRDPKTRQSTNSVFSIDAEKGKTSFSYNFNLKKDSTTAAPATQGRTKESNFAFSYKPNKTLKLDVTSDTTNAAAGGGSGSSQSTRVQKNNATVAWRFRKNSELEISRLSTSNGVGTGGTASKNDVTGINITMPVYQRLGAKLGYNNSKTRAGLMTPGQQNSNVKKASFLTLIYQLQKDSQLTYTINRKRNSNSTQFQSTSFSENGNALDVTYKLLKNLGVKANSTVTNNASTGRMQNTTGSFTLDHKSLHLLPGGTTVSSTRNVNRAGAGLVQTTNRTNSVSMPLSYLRGKLKFTLGTTDTTRNSYASSTVSMTNSLQNTYLADYSPNECLDLVSQVRTINNSTVSSAATSTFKNTRVMTNRLSYKFKTPFKKLDNIKSFIYSASRTRSRTVTDSGTTTGITSMIVSNSGTFNFAPSKSMTTGYYQIEHSHSRQPNGVRFRAIKHHANFGFSTKTGYTVSLDYIAVLQTKGFANSGAFLLKKKVKDGNLLGVSYEYARKNDRLNVDGNTHTHYLEMGMEMSF